MDLVRRTSVGDSIETLYHFSIRIHCDVQISQTSKTGGQQLKAFNNSGSSKSKFDYENMEKDPINHGT